MTFITVSAFVQIVGLAELVNYLSGKTHATVEEDVFEALIAEQDTSAMDADAVAVAQSAIQTLSLALDFANQMVSGFVKSKYPSGLQQSIIDESVLPRLAAKIALVECMQVPDEDSKEERKAAINTLKSIQRGELQLGSAEPVPQSSVSIAVGGGHSNFDWGGFGR